MGHCVQVTQWLHSEAQVQVALHDCWPVIAPPATPSSWARVSLWSRIFRICRFFKAFSSCLRRG
jgi:hypothetical protein